MQKINVKKLLQLSKQNEVRPLHIILGNRGLNKLGEITNITDISSHFQLQSSDEISFTVYKTLDGEDCALWDEIVPLKLIYVKEYEEWFEISVEIDDSEQITKKNITGTSLCEAELSQTYIDATEINTENDPNWTEDSTQYIPTLFYQPDIPKYSLLHRVLNKTPNYTIKHVDETLSNIQRTFSIANSTTVYDCLISTIATEIGCLFLFDTNDRGIYVYDLETTCLSCGERFEDDVKECPKCGSHSFIYPYGHDTSIFIDKYNLGNSLQVSVDNGSIKNCFKVSAGDDNMNAAISMVNANGSNYIYSFNEDMRNDMPNELVQRIDSYNALVKEYQETKVYSLDRTIVDNYNALINRTRQIFTDEDVFPFKPISYDNTGYDSLSKIFYDTLDAYNWYVHSMMPTSMIVGETTAQDEMNKLIESLNTIAVSNYSSCSESTAESAVNMYSRAIVDISRFKLTVTTKSFSKGSTSGVWKGHINIVSYATADETDANKQDKADRDFSVTINDDYGTYINQMAEKTMGKIDTDGIYDLMKIKDINMFADQLKKYSQTSLKTYLEAYTSAQNILAMNKLGEPDGRYKDLYNEYYIPYTERINKLTNELKQRDEDVSIVDSLEKTVKNIMDDTNIKLNFKDYLGDNLYPIFLNYRREDKYENTNYISEGLTNIEQLDKAKELLDVAKAELVKSNTKQYQISGNITNLLLITDENGNKPFEMWLEDFSLGNYIHTKINGEVYNMRVADISLDYDSLDTLNATFYDITKDIPSVVGQTKKLLDNVSSMSSSYSSTMKQASQGQKANMTFQKLQAEGLSSAQYNIFNENSTVEFDNNGILCRAYDDVTNEYSGNQSRLGASGLIFTRNGWESTITALGRQSFTVNGVTHEKYGLNAEFVIAGDVYAGNIYSADWQTDSSGKTIKGTHFNLNEGSFDLAGGRISYNGSDRLTFNNVTLDWTTTNSDTEGLASATNQAISTIDGRGYQTSSDVSTAIGNFQKNVLGATTTTISSKQIISPYIGGGYLYLTKNSNSITLDPEGLTNSTGKGYLINCMKGNSSVFNVDSNGNANFSGNISGSTINNNNGTFIVDVNGNCTANSFTSNNATITGGTFKVSSDNASDSMIEIYNNKASDNWHTMNLSAGGLDLAYQSPLDLGGESGKISISPGQIKVQTGLSSGGDSVTISAYGGSFPFTVSQQSSLYGNVTTMIGADYGLLTNGTVKCAALNCENGGGLYKNLGVNDVFTCYAPVSKIKASPILGYAQDSGDYHEIWITWTGDEFVFYVDNTEVRRW